MQHHRSFAQLRSGTMLGKYRIEGRLGVGGFAAVYQASDTIEGVRVALKIPHPEHLNAASLEDFRREVRLASRLRHPNILPVKNADFIQGWFVVAFPLAERTLADRIRSRLSVPLALDFGDQMLSAVAYAHQHRVIHCDIKPENFLLFTDNRLMLTDFGIAKIALRTMQRASGSGTVGFVAPEQAMGQPSFRSDVFSLGLVLYRMLTGKLPEWPFEWPPPRAQRLQKLPPELVELLRRSIAVDARRRYRDAQQMCNAYQRGKAKALRQPALRAASVSNRGKTARDWKTIRHQQFRRRYGAALETRAHCAKCAGPVAEAMFFCPWCGDHRETLSEDTPFPQHCPRCQRGLKLDWQYCPWCYGPGFEVATARQYSDRRYVGRCGNPRCKRKDLMRFMRYCPWCRRKVRRHWKIESVHDRCPSCRWGVIAEFWSYCPWCGKSLLSS